jgi:hypothetical protein
MLLQPLAIGLPSRNPLLNRPVLENFLDLQIHRNHLARAQATFLHDGFGGHVHHPASDETMINPSWVMA